MNDHRVEESDLPLVFLSYAREDDEPFVMRLYQDLTHRGLRVWWDRKAMESRGRTFLQEIRDAIASLERVILVVGPKAVTSEYVGAEWRFALERCKVVVPILRLGPEAAVPGESRDDDFRLVPEELRGLHVPDFRDDGRYTKALDELVRILSVPVPPLADVSGVDPLPPHFQQRPALLARLRETVLADMVKPTVITSAQQTVTLQGMGGVGKSVIAGAFARSCEVRRTFEDGIIWLRFGRGGASNPTPTLTNLHRVAEMLDHAETASLVDLEAAKAQVAQLLAERSCLLVLDDVWDVEAAAVFASVAGPRSRVIVTTRDASIAVDLGALQCPVDVLDEGQALALLAEWAGTAVRELPTVARALITECGNLPLAVAMVGAMVRGRPADRWDDALARLRNADLEKIRRQFPNYPYPDLLRAIEVSIAALEPEDRERYLDLAIFPERDAVPESALETLWAPLGLDRLDVHDLVDRLVDRSLARRAEQGGIVLHDLQRDYVIRQVAALPVRHRQLVDAYRSRCPAGWASGPDDGYFFERLPWHLRESGLESELARLLLDPDWLEAKLGATDVNAIIADCGLSFDNGAVTLLSDAFRLSADALDNRPDQLRGQLLGRLPTGFDDTVDSLRARLASIRTSTWLRPCRPSLARAGGPLVRTIRPLGRRHWYTPKSYALLVTPDFAQVVFPTAEKDPDKEIRSSLRAWDLTNGSEVYALHGHRGTVLDIALVGGGDTIISLGEDRTLRLWNLLAGQQFAVIELDQSCVSPNAVCPLPGGRRLLCACSDELQLWDLEEKRLVSRHTPDLNAIHECLITPEGGRAIVLDWTGNVQLLDIESWSVVWTSTGHCKYGSITLDGKGQTLFVTAVLMKPDDIFGDLREVLQVSKEVQVLNLETGEPLERLAGESEGFPINALAAMPDGSGVVVGMNDDAVQIRYRGGQKPPSTRRESKSHVRAIRVSRDGTRALTFHADYTFKVWDLGRFDSSPVSDVHTSTVMQVEICGDGREAVSVSGDRTLKIWRLDTATARATLRADSWLYDVVVLPDGRHALTAEALDTNGAVLRLWDLEKGSEIAVRRRDWGGKYHALTLTGDGRYAIASWYIDDVMDHYTGLIAWDVERLEPTVRAEDSRYETGPTLHAHRLSMATDLGLGLSPNYYGVTLWKIVDGSPVFAGVIRTGNTVDVVQIPGSHHIAALLAYGQGIEVWDLDTSRKVASVSGAYWSCIAASANGRLLVVGGPERRLSVLRAATLERLADFSFDVPIYACSISPDACRVVAGDENGGVHLLELEGGPSE